MKRPLILALAAMAALLGAGAAQAGHVSWSVGINVPPVATVVAAPVYGPANVYGYGPGYGYAEPAPRYVAPIVVRPPIRYLPTPVLYAPRPRLWLPPLPRLPRPVFFGFHGGYGHDRHDDYRGHGGWDGHR